MWLTAWCTSLEGGDPGEAPPEPLSRPHFTGLTASCVVGLAFPMHTPIPAYMLLPRSQ